MAHAMVRISGVDFLFLFFSLSLSLSLSLSFSLTLLLLFFSPSQDKQIKRMPALLASSSFSVSMETCSVV